MQNKNIVTLDEKQLAEMVADLRKISDSHEVSEYASSAIAIIADKMEILLFGRGVTVEHEEEGYSSSLVEEVLAYMQDIDVIDASGISKVSEPADVR